jgi:hypothetical protein
MAEMKTLFWRAKTGLKRDPM